MYAYAYVWRCEGMFWAQPIQLNNVIFLSTAIHYRTIKRQDFEARKILGEKIFEDLDHLIYSLMDGSTFLNLTSEKNGPTIYQGMITRNYAENVDHMKDKTVMPTFKGKFYHELFGAGPSRYS